MKNEIPDAFQIKLTKQIQTHKFSNHIIGTIISGVGCENAEKATKMICRDFNPDFIIVLGFCGGTQTKLNIGEIIIFDNLHYKSNKISIESPHLSNIKKNLTKDSIAFHTGKLQTFDYPVLSRKNLLDGIIGVDMESYFIAQISKKYNIPTLVIRSISDIIPIKKPLLFPKFRLIIRIYRNKRKAKKGLNVFFENMIKNL